MSDTQLFKNVFQINEGPLLSDQLGNVGCSVCAYFQTCEGHIIV